MGPFRYLPPWYWVTLGRRDTAWGRSKLAGFLSSLPLQGHHFQIRLETPITSDQRPLAPSHTSSCPIHLWSSAWKGREQRRHPCSLVRNGVHLRAMGGGGIPGGGRTCGVRDQGTVMGDSFAKVPKDHNPNTFSMFSANPRLQCLYTAWAPWLITVEVVWCSRKHMGPGHKPYVWLYCCVVWGKSRTFKPQLSLLQLDIDSTLYNYLTELR